MALGLGERRAHRLPACDPSGREVLRRDTGHAAAVQKWIEYYETAGGSYETQLGKVDAITVNGPVLQIHLAVPNPAIEWWLTGVNELGDVVSPTALADPSSLSTQTDGAGPYVLDTSATVPGSSYTYVPNKYYYDQSAIHYNKIVLRVITSATTMEEALSSGQIQVAQGSPATATAAQSAGSTSSMGSRAGMASRSPTSRESISRHWPARMCVKRSTTRSTVRRSPRRCWASMENRRLSGSRPTASPPPCRITTTTTPLRRRRCSPQPVISRVSPCLSSTLPDSMPMARPTPR